MRPRRIEARWCRLIASTISAVIPLVPTPCEAGGPTTRPVAPTPLRVALVYSPKYNISLVGLEKLHPFDINKYEKIYRQLLADKLIRPADVSAPEEISEKDLLRVHTTAYLKRLQNTKYLARYLEFPAASLMLPGVADAVVLKPFRYATGGTLLAARLALERGIAINIGGGYHHAGPDAGGGFCIYADMPIAIRVLQAEGKIKRALVVDLDVHQGNGTALCFKDDDTVFTFDMHEEDIFPIPKEENDWDVPFEPGLTDEDYLDWLRQCLAKAFDLSKPDIVFLQAGVDVLAGDPLAKLRMTENGVVARDQEVFAEAVRRKVPIVMVTGGGYSKAAWHAQYRSIRATLERYAARAATTTNAPK